MTKKVILLTGVSGSGKTYTRIHDERLASLPYLDIADIYAQLDVRWDQALKELISRIHDTLELSDQVVVEGYFLKGSPSRRILEQELARRNIVLELIELAADYRTSFERIRSDVEKDVAEGMSREHAEARAKKRMEILESIRYNTDPNT